MLCTIEDSDIKIGNIDSKCTEELITAANDDCSDDWIGLDIPDTRPSITVRAKKPQADAFGMFSECVPEGDTASQCHVSSTAVGRPR